MLVKNAIGIVVAAVAFIIGISVLPAEPETLGRDAVDYNVYAVTEQELAENPQLFDRKLIELTAKLQIRSSTSIGSLTFGPKWMRWICVAKNEQCTKLEKSATYFCSNHEWETTATVTGRFNANVPDPHPLQRGNRVMLLEINRVDPENDGFGYGCGSGSGNGTGSR